MWGGDKTTDLTQLPVVRIIILGKYIYANVCMYICVNVCVVLYCRVQCDYPDWHTGGIYKLRIAILQHVYPAIDDLSEKETLHM